MNLLHDFILGHRKGGPKRLVTGDQLQQRFIQLAGIHRSIEPERFRQVIGYIRRNSLLQQIHSALCRGYRVIRLLWRLHDEHSFICCIVLCFFAGNQACKLLQARMFEQVCCFQLQTPRRIELIDQLHGEYRISADFEEVVIDMQLAVAQQTSPSLGKLLFLIGEKTALFTDKKHTRSFTSLVQRHILQTLAPACNSKLHFRQQISRQILIRFELLQRESIQRRLPLRLLFHPAMTLFKRISRYRKMAAAFRRVQSLPFHIGSLDVQLSKLAQ
ncbi:hypothetical protein D3C84_689760 [compost metagenome]